MYAWQQKLTRASVLLVSFVFKSLTRKSTEGHQTPLRASADSISEFCYTRLIPNLGPRTISGNMLVTATYKQTVGYENRLRPPSASWKRTMRAILDAATSLMETLLLVFR